MGPPKRTDSRRRNGPSTKRKIDQMSDDAVAPLPTPDLTPPRQGGNRATASTSKPATKRQRLPFDRCTRCLSLFQKRAPLPPAEWNERTNSFCSRCFMLLYVCETKAATDTLLAQCERGIPTLDAASWEVWQGQLLLLSQSLVAEGKNIVKAAMDPKTKELFEKEGEKRPWSTVIYGLDRSLNWLEVQNEASVRLLGDKWRSELKGWINMASMMLLHTFFDPTTPVDPEQQCGGHCEHCKRLLRSQEQLCDARRAQEDIVLTLPAIPSPSSPWSTRPVFSSKLDELAALDKSLEKGFTCREQRPASWRGDPDVSKLNFDDWVVRYDEWKGYDQALQDNMDKFDALDGQP
ncbi:hypothetical protein QBC41DRAFT_395625 [Cercophora samala]|uniref:Uncharacterized protein n=1 Tax=Cercophora samala TaxID=330535 RepID=A0AA39ZLG7_9PEZI|nr:hypothetical protein QBC41DRAFT_395625 [Cercophora samala]